MKKHHPLLLAVTLLAACAGPGSNSNQDSSARQTPTPTPPKEERPLTKAEEVAQNELLAQDAEDMPTDRAAARQAAVNAVSELPAKWEVVGVHAEHFAANIYRVTVDVRSGQKTGLIDYAVMQYYPENGEPYWKARPLRRSVERDLHALADVETLNQLNDAKSEVKRLENELDDRDN